jgi:hypothetical protein
LELAEQHKIHVEELNLPVHVEDTDYADADVRVAQTRSLTSKNCRHISWIQCSYIIYMHLHQNIGGNDIGHTYKLTGVNNNIFVGWLSKPSLLSCWLPLVASIKPTDLLNVFPSKFQECFNIIDNTSQVSLKQYHQIASKAKGTQSKILFTGKEVSCFLYDSSMPVHLIFFSTRVKQQ